MNRITRIVQIMWMAIAAICAVEATREFTNPQGERNTAYLLLGVAAFAVFRFIVLRRQQLKKDGKL